MKIQRVVLSIGVVSGVEKVTHENIGRESIIRTIAPATVRATVQTTVQATVQGTIDSVTTKPMLLNLTTCVEYTN